MSFEWNNVIQRMQRNESMIRLLRKLYPLWQNGKVTVLMYSALNTVSFADFKDIEECANYFNRITVDMVYIKTSYSECNIYMHQYETYRFNKERETLTIDCGLNKYEIKI